MKKLFTSFFFLMILIVSANAQTIQWQKLLGGTGNDQFANFKTQQTSDGGYIVVGNTIEAGGPGPGTGTLTGLTNNGSFDGWVVKLDASGNTTWQKLLGGSSDDRLYGVQQTADGGYIAIGYSLSSNNGTLTGITGNGNVDGWIVKLDANGKTTWQKLFGGQSDDYFFGISQSSDGGYIVTGQSNSSNSGTLTGITNNGGAFDGWVIKMDATGTITWQKLLGGNSIDVFREVRQTTDGGYVAAGYSTSSNSGTLTGVTNNGAEDGWIVKLDAAGNTTWQKLLGGNGTDYLTPIQQTSDGGYITALASKSSSNTGTLTGLTNHGDFDGWVIKLDASGNTTWQKLLGGDNDDEFYGCRQTNDGGYALSGYSKSSNTGTLTGFTNQGNYDGWFVILDAAGNTRTQQLLGGNNDDRFFTLGVASDGYILEGYSATPDGSGTFTGISYNGGASDGWALKLLKLVTITSITSSLNPSIAGQSITFTATVSTATGTPTGTVTFFDGTTNIGSGTLSGNTATLTTTVLAAGPHNITASYNSDAIYGVSTSPVLTQVVKAITTTAVTSSLNPSNAGQSVTFTATINGAFGSPTGTVTFFDGTTNLGTGTMSGNTATLTTITLAAGPHSITATYGGDTYNTSSTSAALTQVVKAITTTSVTSSLNPSVAGQSVTFTATIAGAFGTPTGTITFFDGTTNLGNGSLSGNTATFTTTTLAAGPHNITATYNGDTYNTSSTSSSLNQIVKAVTTISVTSSVNPSTRGQSITFTATISGAFGTPKGTVTFFDGATSLGSVSLSGNSATFSTSALSVGPHNITAAYNGDANNTTSTSSVLAQAVNYTSLITDYFRTKQSGNWNDVNTWEGSPDNINWFSATLTPDFNSNTVTVLNSHSVTITANLTIDQTTINSGGSVLVNTSVVLIVNDGAGTDLTINSGATMTIKSTVTGTGSIGNSAGSISGSITVERYISNKRAWRLLGIPFISSTQTIKSSWMEGGSASAGFGTQITTYPGDPNAANFDAQKPASSIRIYVADNFNSDVDHTPNTANNILTNAGAYFLFVRGDRSVDRTISGAASSATTLRITGGVNSGNTTRGFGTTFSMIANPYPSAVDFDAIKAIGSNSSISTYYVWDASLGTVGQYRTVTISGSAPNYTYTATPGVTSNNWKFIESGSAFMIPGRSTVLFTEATKSAGTPPSSMLRIAALNETQLAINLNLINADNSITLADGVREVFDNNYSNAVDKDDAKKITGFDLNLGIESNKDVLAVEKRTAPKANDIIYLKLWNTAPGNYQFEMQPANFSSQTLFAYLYDSYLNTYSPVDLKNTTTVTFSILTDAASSASNRFSLVFKSTRLFVDKPSIVIYPNPVQNGLIKLQMKNMPAGNYFVKLMNNLGQIIVNKQIIHTQGNSVETLNLNSSAGQGIKGAYMLEVINPDNTKTLNKLIIN